MSKKSNRHTEEQLLSELKNILTTNITDTEHNVLAPALTDLETRLAKNLDTSDIPDKILFALSLPATRQELSESVKPLYLAISQGQYRIKQPGRNLAFSLSMLFRGIRP